MQIRRFREISPSGAAMGLFIVLGHVYLALRLVVPSGLSIAWRVALMALLGALALLTLCQPMVSKLPLRTGRCLAWLGFLWMGVGLVQVVLLATADLLLWATGASMAYAAEPVPLSHHMGRATVAGGLVVTAIGLYGAIRPPRIRHIPLTIPGWPTALSGYRIIQISDLHIGAMTGRRFARKITARCNRLKGDLIAITGDLVDGPVDLLVGEVAPFGRLKAPDGVFFVTGNHDHYADADGWCEKVRGWGITPLRNESRRIAGGAATIAGIDDAPGSRIEDLDRALAKQANLMDLADPANLSPDHPVVLLSHDPELFRQAATRGVGLQLSGHTHGGQIWPLGYLVRLSTPYIAGHYRIGRSQLYVSRGTGFWGPPLRLLAPAEITVLELSAEAA